MASAQIPGAFISHLKKRIGFFGGSFDPIHFGHLFLALQLAEAHKLDSVLVCPAFHSPFKKGESSPRASAQHRFEMVKRALEGIPHFEATSIEIDRGGPSYTIDTIRALPSNEYHLLLSEEAASQFDRWKEADELIRLAPPLIGCRRDGSSSSLPESLKKGFTPTKNMDLSSTDIRERLNKKLYCGHLIPAKALDYIFQHRLYSGSN